MQVENCIEKEKEGLMLPCAPMRRNSSDTCIPTCSSPAAFNPDRLSVKEATGCTLLCTSLPPSDDSQLSAQRCFHRACRDEEPQTPVLGTPCTI
jgi:hypothetical protein